MPIYTFYPYTAEGSALMFEAIDLADDEIAMAHAGHMLSQHASAAEVVVWQEDRQVHREAREKPRAQEIGDLAAGPSA